jgi:hypothetical protein
MDTLDQRFARHVGKRFTGKPGRIQARGNNDVHNRSASIGNLQLTQSVALFDRLRTADRI